MAGAGSPALLAKSTRKSHGAQGKRGRRGRELPPPNSMASPGEVGVHAAHSRRLWRVPQISLAEPSPATGLVMPLPRRVGEASRGLPAPAGQARREASLAPPAPTGLSRPPLRRPSLRGGYPSAPSRLPTARRVSRPPSRPRGRRGHPAQPPHAGPRQAVPGAAGRSAAAGRQRRSGASLDRPGRETSAAEPTSPAAALLLPERRQGKAGRAGETRWGQRR